MSHILHFSYPVFFLSPWWNLLCFYIYFCSTLLILTPIMYIFPFFYLTKVLTPLRCFIFLLCEFIFFPLKIIRCLTEQYVSEEDGRGTKSRVLAGFCSSRWLWLGGAWRLAFFCWHSPSSYPTFNPRQVSLTLCKLTISPSQGSLGQVSLHYNCSLKESKNKIGEVWGKNT